MMMMIRVVRARVGLGDAGSNGEHFADAAWSSSDGRRGEEGGGEFGAEIEISLVIFVFFFLFVDNFVFRIMMAMMMMMLVLLSRREMARVVLSSLVIVIIIISILALIRDRRSSQTDLLHHPSIHLLGSTNLRNR
jgi:hypothetical protein